MAAQGNQQAVESILFAEAAAAGPDRGGRLRRRGLDRLLSGASRLTAMTVDDPGRPARRDRRGGHHAAVAGSPPSETAWNDLYGSGGGGVSGDFSQPGVAVGARVSARRAAQPQCAALGRSSCREVPDVSASADPAHGYPIYCTAGTVLRGDRVVRRRGDQRGLAAVGGPGGRHRPGPRRPGRSAQPGALLGRFLRRLTVQRRHDGQQRPVLGQPGPVPGHAPTTTWPQDGARRSPAPCWPPSPPRPSVRSSPESCRPGVR